MSIQTTDNVSSFTRFLWWCAGADPRFLMLSPYQDRVKYAGIGGIVFSTGVLAAFAGGFAFNTAFGPKGMAGDQSTNITWAIFSCVFGLCWGTLIFNMDRFIVSSAGKGDGTDSVTWKEAGNALPRLFIAVIFALTISKPLELKIIQTEIDVELRKKQQDKLDQFNKYTYAKYKEQINLIDEDLKKLETDRNTLVERQKAAEQEYIDQMQGRAGMAGYGPRAKQLETLKNEKQKEVEDYDSKHAQEIANLKAGRDKKLAEQEHELNVVNKKQAENLDGILERIEIANDIGLMLGRALFLIFLCIEAGPIVFKLMMNKGVYDYLVENYNYRMYVQNGIVKEEYVYEGRDGMKLMEKVNFLEVETDKKEKVEQLKAQEALSKRIIGIWSSLKQKEIDANPSSHYREKTTGQTD